jgi:hypothetical protein
MDDSDFPEDLGETYVVRETAKAILVRLDGDDVWIPKSVIHDDSEVWDGKENAAGHLIVKAWFARREGWV